LKVVAVKFRDSGRIQIFSCEGFDPKINDWVLVETDKGVTLAWVVVEPWEAAPEEVKDDIKKVIRIATKEDLEKAQHLKRKEAEAKQVCRRLITRHQLPMKLVDVEALFGENKIIFYFTAENRVDFRKLVKDLARRFHCKVEMCQIGVRNEAKILGGLGPCGRELCCTAFLQSFEPVSVKMAKDQNLSLNPLKLSGLCGRLMCCLSFEHELYLDLKEKFPQCRKWVVTTKGVGKVKRLNVLADKVIVAMPDGQEIEVDLEDVKEVLPAKPDLTKS
jgi:cell fate regulator YaaT (PSP1 superfamily)